MADENGKAVDREALVKALTDESTTRAKRVMEKVLAFLEEEDCAIQAEPYLKEGLIYARWGVFAKR